MFPFGNGGLVTNAAGVLPGEFRFLIAGVDPAASQTGVNPVSRKEASLVEGMR